MKSIASLGILLILSACATDNTLYPSARNPGRSIVKIQALSDQGRQYLGSGVVIGKNIIATNCHVTRSARRINLIKEDRLYHIESQAALPDLDVCILKSEALPLPTVALAEDDTPNLGDEVTIGGYPYALNLRMTRGNVVALYPQGDGTVIQINAGFNHGASGGGVFDRSGKLVGLMTFMGKQNGELQFYVIPASWLSEGLEEAFTPLAPFFARSFWETGNFIKPLAQ